MTIFTSKTVRVCHRALHSNHIAASCTQHEARTTATNKVNGAGSAHARASPCTYLPPTSRCVTRKEHELESNKNSTPQKGSVAGGADYTMSDAMLVVSSTAGGARKKGVAP